jgi:hypothetical protein
MSLVIEYREFQTTDPRPKREGFAEAAFVLTARRHQATSFSNGWSSDSFDPNPDSAIVGGGNLKKMEVCVVMLFSVD